MGLPTALGGDPRCRYGRFSATIRPLRCKLFPDLDASLELSMPSNCVSVSAILPRSSIIDGISSPCRTPISKSFRIVCRRDFDCTSAEFRVDVPVGDDQDLAIQERMREALADQIAVAFVVGMHRYRGVAEHGLDTRGRHHDVGFVVA